MSDRALRALIEVRVTGAESMATACVSTARSKCAWRSPTLTSGGGGKKCLRTTRQPNKLCALTDKCRPTCGSGCGNEPTRGGSSDGKDTGGDHRPKHQSPPPHRRWLDGGSGEWDGGNLHCRSLCLVSPYFSRSSEVLLSVVVSASITYQHQHISKGEPAVLVHVG